MTRTRLSGRAALHAAVAFDTTNCPYCGALLARYCTRCKSFLVAPVLERCEFCGLPHPWSVFRRRSFEPPAPRSWHPETRGVHEPAILAYEGPAGNLWVFEGDIARLKIDAVISTDDVDGKMWTEIARAIKSAAGEDIERHAAVGAPFPQGHAWVTRPGALTAVKKGVIHVALMNRKGESSLGNVRDCLVAALRKARKVGCGSIGVPTIGSGPNAIRPEKWLKTFADVAIADLSVASERSSEQQDGAPKGGTSATPAITDLPVASERSSEQQDGARRLDIVLVLYEADDFALDVQRVQRAAWRAWRRAGRPRHGSPAVDLRWRKRLLRAIRRVVTRLVILLRRRLLGPFRRRRPGPGLTPRGSGGE